MLRTRQDEVATASFLHGAAKPHPKAFLPRIKHGLNTDQDFVRDCRIRVSSVFLRWPQMRFCRVGRIGPSVRSTNGDLVIILRFDLPHIFERIDRRCSFDLLL